MRIRSSGFAMVAVLLILALVIAAAVAATALSATDARRTGMVAIDAQLRQLLHAGALEAQRRISEGSVRVAESVQVALPSDVAERGNVALKIMEEVAGGAKRAEVRANFAGRSAEETVRFENRGGHWIAVDVRMD